MRRAIVAAGLLFSAHAWGFHINPSDLSNPSALLDPSIVSPLIRGWGFSTDHRAYEAASGLGTHAGFELSAQAVLTKLPDDFRQTLQTAGLQDPPLPVIPVPRLILHKGLGDRLDIGFSWLRFQGISLIGGDVKVVVFKPDEGPVWAIRMNYSASKVRFDASGAYLQLEATTWKPEILLSQPLDFAEPYLGVGYELTRGSVSFNLPLPAPFPNLSGATGAKGGGGLAFMGLALRVPGIGLRLTLDGEYSTVGAHALGAKFGFNF